jgi:hypothetical protein
MIGAALAKHNGIQDLIYTMRGVQVMLDRDLAKLYMVETKVLNQTVRRNSARFPREFMFQLTSAELENWKSQFVTSNRERMGLRKLPFAFTEQGVAMLSAVLRSETAIQVSLKIINAFVAMRRVIAANGQIFSRLDMVERKQIEYKLEADEKFKKIFSAMEAGEIKPRQGIFYDGQIFDAYRFVSDLFRSAKKSIVIIDNYIDDTVLAHLAKRPVQVTVTILTRTISAQLALDVKKYNEQYPAVTIKEFKNSHDRFVIIDGNTVYHFGASLKDLGKKWFAFSKMDIGAMEMLGRLEGVEF